MTRRAVRTSALVPARRRQDDSKFGQACCEQSLPMVRISSRSLLASGCGTLVHGVDLVERDVDNGWSGVEHRSLGESPEAEWCSVQREFDVLDLAVVVFVRLVLDEAE